MIKDFELTAPVLLIGFNRPEIIKQSFEYIRAASPKKLYVAVDGPRPGKEGEESLVEQVKKVVENVDWPCETHYTFHDTNKGAEINVSSAISWVLEKEEYLIVLEDDIVVPPAFFKFMQEMLIRYKDDERINTVTGNNLTPIPSKTDYFFAKYGHSHGWGTWRRFWNKFDLNLQVPEEHLKKSFLKTITNSKAELNYYYKKFRQININGPGNNTWDVVALYIHRATNGLSVVPKVNLAMNIGLQGYHAKGKKRHHLVPYDENFTVNIHPDAIQGNTEYDKHHFKHHIIAKNHFLEG